MPDKMHYCIGAIASKFKFRIHYHVHSFNIKRKVPSISLAKYIWGFKVRNVS